MHTEIKRGAGFFALAVALVATAAWMTGSDDASIAANAGPTGLVGLACLIIAAVMVARGLIRD